MRNTLVISDTTKEIVEEVDCVEVVFSYHDYTDNKDKVVSISHDYGSYGCDRGTFEEAADMCLEDLTTTLQNKCRELYRLAQNETNEDKCDRLHMTRFVILDGMDKAYNELCNYSKYEWVPDPDDEDQVKVYESHKEYVAGTDPETGEFRKKVRKMMGKDPKEEE